MDTQRIHEMHFFLSEVLGLSAEIAPAGQLCTHTPHELQVESALGIMPASELLYGRLPGIVGSVNFFELTLSRI